MCLVLNWPCNARHTLKMATQNNTPLTLSLLTHFRCSVCFAICTPKIVQCLNGHITCNVCLAKSDLNTCPVCRADKADAARNLLAERVLLTLNPQLTCCGRRMAYSDLADGTHACPQMGLVPCLSEKCGLELPAPEMESHLLRKHSGFRPDSDVFYTFIYFEASNSVTWRIPFAVLKCGGKLFFAVKRCDGNGFKIWVKTAELNDDEAEFIYTVKVNGTKQVFTSEVTSFANRIEDEECFNMPRTEMKRISGKNNGLIKFGIIVKKVIPDLDNHEYDGIPHHVNHDESGIPSQDDSGIQSNA